MPTIRDEIFRLYPLHAQRIIEETYKQRFELGCDISERWLNELQGPGYLTPLNWLFRWKNSKEGHMYWASLANA